MTFKKKIRTGGQSFTSAVGFEVSETEEGRVNFSLQMKWIVTSFELH